MTSFVSVHTSSVITDLNSLKSDLENGNGDLPDKSRLDSLKRSFILIADLSSEEFKKWKSLLISFYEMSGYTTPVDLVSASPLSLAARISPFTTPAFPTAPLQVTPPPLDADIRAVLGDLSPSFPIIAEEFAPLSSASSKPPHLELFGSLLELTREFVLISNPITTDDQSAPYLAHLNSAIRLDLIDKSLKEETSYEILRFLKYCLQNIKLLYSFIGCVTPVGVTILFKNVCKEMDEFPEILDLPETNLFFMLEKSQENGFPLKEIKAEFQKFLASLSSFSEIDRSAYTTLIKVKLFILIRNFWQSYTVEPLTLSLDEFLALSHEALFDTIISKLPRLSLLTLAGAFFRFSESVAPPSIVVKKPSLKRDRVEVISPKPPSPIKVAKPGGTFSNRFEVDLKKPITTKGTGYHFTDFREALIALSEGNYALGLEYIILLIRFYDTILLREIRFPPSHDCNSHMKTYFCIVYHYISLMKDCNDPRVILVENAKMMTELEIHRKEIKSYLELYNPIEQITPVLADFKAACLEACNLKLMSLEDVAF